MAGYHENESISEIGNSECLIAYCLYSLGDAEKALQYYRKLKYKQCINGIYENLILENNILANEYEMNDEIKENENEKKEHEKHLLLYKKLLCHKNKNLQKDFLHHDHIQKTNDQKFLCSIVQQG